MLNNVFEWFDDPQIKHSPDGTQFEVIVDAPERAEVLVGIAVFLMAA